MAKQINEKCYIYINGRILGYVKDGSAYAKEIRTARRSGILSGEVNVAYIKKLNAVHINTDNGRIRKPYIVVEGGKSKLTAELREKLKNKEIDFGYLIRHGIIEYLDAEEEENTLVVFSEKGITEQTTHIEVDMTSLFGFTLNVSPFPEHNNAARHAMLSNFIKQSQGLYATNFNFRFDSRSYLLFYPQAPIVSTAVFRSANMQRHPSGQNFVVALTTYYGYNMADAIVLNKGAVDRGLGRSMFYKTYTDEERRYPGGQKDVFKVPSPTAEGYLGEHAYSKLSEDGIIEPETIVNEGDVLIGKVAPPRFLEESISASGLEEKIRDDSTTLKAGEKGVIDSVVFTESTGATKVVKVRIKSLRIPEKGDKFASRQGQKGVAAYIVPQEDMPFNEQGIVPDLLLNPHSVPNRLTFGHLLEELAGKAGAVSGNAIDGTAFAEKGSDRISDYGKTLEENGFDKFGDEVLYDGITGRRFTAKIFNGIVYYNRLYHMVSNKLQVRSRGPVQILTHQPTEGKARQGGLRFGEMERDVLVGYGASLLLKERLLDQSDKASVLICKDCGNIGYYDYIKRSVVCPICGGNSLSEVEISYAFKLLLDEIKSMHIFPRLKLKE
ncbi:MAG: DNA-directed RNA polymerase subunit B [Candidatus Micrarchaeota archaeon]|nr:DNA-directed RNA polymerase subunit B [Candidatus Micrarchaeota archaeon]MDE1847957.1 DNA-directed RNA polymerase subunit B [Candidatus Micrarchaeota archaeon]MDE1864325.1 DNA-directed RNA polymerase subunit B [Candidatus Micrarchaeota archaeon]